VQVNFQSGGEDPQPGLLALVALVASAVPALRAADSDPIVALRGE
jgi:hypothetical protein